MTRTIITGVVVGIAGALLVPTIGNALHTTDGNTATTPVASALVESRECSGPSATPSSDGTAGTVTVNVPRVAFLYFDAAGNVRAAATNTGCAPRSGDAVYVYSADGSGPTVGSFDLTTVRWVGDFTTPGVPQPQD